MAIWVKSSYNLRSKKTILITIVTAQFLCTSLWFASNGVIGDLVNTFNFFDSAIGHLTSAVQLGFISGTLGFAILTISDRFSPSKVFFISACLAALFNLGIIWEGHNLTSIISLRFFTGFFLAGIYPVGMKIATDYYEKGLGKSLGFLVGALVLGTALPHLLKSISLSLSWKFVFMATSSLSVIGGLIMIVFVPNGPFRKPSTGLDFSTFFMVFKNSRFKAAAFGYFGHMWELYAFWAFVPVMLSSYAELYPDTRFNIPLLSFLIIGLGGLACVIAGYLSTKRGVKKIALLSLFLSCCCCLISPLIFNIESDIVFISFLMLWGMAVIADSPLFSTLVAHNASVEIKGTALTIVNCIGFAITILSIQLINLLNDFTDSNSIYVILAIGPILGLWALKRKNKPNSL